MIPLYALYLFPLLATAGVAWVALISMGRPPGELAANANYLATLLRQQLELRDRGTTADNRTRIAELATSIRAEADAVRRELEREHRERRVSALVAGLALGCEVLATAILLIVAWQTSLLPALLLSWWPLLTAVLATVFVPALLRVTLWNMLPELAISSDILDLLEQWLRDTSSDGQLFQRAANRYSEWRGRRRTFLGRMQIRLLGATSAEQT